MVWIINKHKRADKQGKIIKHKQYLESQPKLKSCLKTKNYSVAPRDSLNDSSELQDDLSNSKVREQSSKSGGSRGVRSSSSIFSADVESKGSGNSSLSFKNRKRVASVEHNSMSSRSWDRESRKSEVAQSTQTSERSSTDSRSHAEKKKRKVHFTSIHIREYEIVVGDNPSCTIGPPVGIGWKYGETRVIDIDTVENSRSYKKIKSRLVLSREEREALLLNWGASFHDIIESVRANLKIKNQRRQTVTNLGKIERIEEAFESATRKLKSALMLRRSTGNKVKRLQEQANLAQSALTSLKIAEDRALSEIRGTSRVEIVKEPKSQEDFNSFPMSNYSPSSPKVTEAGQSRIVTPEEELSGKSVTQSELEIEKFYAELELEMFGEEELPSLVGQMLEVPLKSRAKNSTLTEDSSVNSGMTSRYSRDDLDDELLEKEQNRSMISQYLLEDTENDLSKFDQPPHDEGEHDVNRHYYSSQPTQPQHREKIKQQHHYSWNSSSPVNFSNIIHSNGQQQTIPLHAGMTMFEDCALLGAQNVTPYHESTRHNSRKNDINAGPKIQFKPPPTHLTPSHWMDDSDSLTIPARGHDTITIFEDNLNESRHIIYQGGSHAYSHNLNWRK